MNKKRQTPEAALRAAAITSLSIGAAVLGFGVFLEAQWAIAACVLLGLTSLITGLAGLMMLDD